MKFFEEFLDLAEKSSQVENDLREANEKNEETRSGKMEGGRGGAEDI